MGLERGLGDVKDELQMFIESQKRKVDSDKRELMKAQDALSPRDNQPSRISDNASQQGHKFSNKSADAEADYQSGLPLGQYELRKKAMRDERVRDYKKYAAEKELRRTGKIDPSLLEGASPRAGNRKARDETSRRSEVTTPDIVDAYAALLRKKRAEERAYRENYDDPEVTNDRRVRFDDSENETYSSRPPPNINDEELFQWAREKAKSGRRQHSAGNVKSEKPNDVDEGASTRAKSVPPSTTAGIFGDGGGAVDESRRRKEQYKKDLEMQIKEKEEQKYREKLKKLGRITSSDELNIITKKEESTTNNKPVTSENHTEDRYVEPTSGSRSGSRSYGRPRYEDDHHDPRLGYQGYPGMPYRGMGGYDPYMQMMPGRFDPRMDPYLMQNPGYAGFPGYSGIMYGPSAGMMPRPDRFDDRGRDGDYGGGRTSRRDSQARNLKSPHIEAPVQETVSVRTSEVKSKHSPRSVAVTAGVFGDDTPDKGAERAAKIAYQEELRKQMQEKQAAKEKEKRERERYEAKMEAEMAKYDPWGRAGGGAPVKDQSGHLVADLRTLHKYNEDGVVVSPRGDVNSDGNLANLPKDSPVLAALNGFQNIANSSPNASPRGNFENQAQGRGAALMELQGIQKNPTQKKEQQSYQDFLRQQIEEKKRIKDEEERKQKEEEDKENRRLEEQRIKMEQEFLIEQEKERRKEEEVRQKNDEMRKVAELKRQEAEKERKEIEADRFRSILKRSSELKQQSIETSNRPSSPPIPALQNNSRTEYNRPASRQLPTLAKKQTTEFQQQDHVRPVSRPIPTLTKQQNIEMHMESQATQLSNPPSRQYDRSKVTIDHCQSSKSNTNEQADVDMQYLNIIRQQLLRGNSEIEGANSGQTSSQTHVIKQLAVLRKQLSTEEQKVQKELEKNEKYQETKTKTKSITKQKSEDRADIFEKARIRRGSAKRRTAAKHADQFNKLADASSVIDLKLPNRQVTVSELDLQQREFIRLQEQKLHALREAIKDTSDFLMVNIDNDKTSSTKVRRSSKQSLLESDSQFIKMDDQSVRLSSRLSTAQSNRRYLNAEDSLEEPYESRTKTPGGYSIGSMTSQAIEEMAAKNEERLKSLQAEGRRDVATPEDPEDIIDKYLRSSSQRGSRPQTGQSEKSLPSNTALK
ncbi:centrosome and spindle pole-associated protein 1-like isoform X2 [Rhopilema esculentum]|uniref:centrosome and spindle pole-associated protein 1-like isoform X2 n=1 Tax=Rhopilema esculentum TaxID=499914 RepID=UPI0031D0B774